MKWLHSFGSVAAVILTVASPWLQGAITGHPAIAAGLAAAYAILGQFAPHATSSGPVAGTGGSMNPQ